MTIRLPNSKLPVAPVLDGYQMTLSGVNPNIALQDCTVYYLNITGSGNISIESSVEDNAVIILYCTAVSGTATLVGGITISLVSDFIPDVDANITLLWTGTAWSEISRGNYLFEHHDNAQIDFGATPVENTSVSVAAPWVTANTNVNLSMLASGSINHDADDVWVEGIRPYVGTITPGVGFNIICTCNNTTTGIYNILWSTT